MVVDDGAPALIGGGPTLTSGGTSPFQISSRNDIIFAGGSSTIDILID
ncbi:hypothetical protein A2U01_0059285, partial [Trifolium medium]|nr:hypothetical protein [Trifolium medium]